VERKTVIVGISLRWGAVSITGNFRDNNEDRYLIHPQGSYFLVADGMGGQSAGEKASEMAVELIAEKLDELVDFERAGDPAVSRGIDEAVSHANIEIMALSELDPSFHNMGTTIALAVRAGNKLHIAGIGDSPVYLIRSGKVERLTQDHSLTQALLDAGTITEEEAVRHRYKNVLYRYLGAKEGGTGAKAQAIEPAAGDRFILCSDGATDGLSEKALLKLSSEHSDPESLAKAIVAAAQAAGSRDNITCVSIFVD
jgi:serine/threonine protein phosphatase PrpC